MTSTPELPTDCWKIIFQYLSDYRPVTAANHGDPRLSLPSTLQNPNTTTVSQQNHHIASYGLFPIVCLSLASKSWSNFAFELALVLDLSTAANYPSDPDFVKRICAKPWKKLKRIIYGVHAASPLSMSESVAGLVQRLGPGVDELCLLLLAPRSIEPHIGCFKNSLNDSAVSVVSLQLYAFGYLTVIDPLFPRTRVGPWHFFPPSLRYLSFHGDCLPSSRVWDSSAALFPNLEHVFVSPNASPRIHWCDFSSYKRLKAISMGTLMSDPRNRLPPTWDYSSLDFRLSAQGIFTNGAHPDKPEVYLGGFKNLDEKIALATQGCAPLPDCLIHLVKIPPPSLSKDPEFLDVWKRAGTDTVRTRLQLLMAQCCFDPFEISPVSGHNMFTFALKFLPFNFVKTVIFGELLPSALAAASRPLNLWQQVLVYRDWRGVISPCLELLSEQQALWLLNTYGQEEGLREFQHARHTPFAFFANHASVFNKINHLVYNNDKHKYEAALNAADDDGFDLIRYKIDRMKAEQAGRFYERFYAGNYVSMAAIGITTVLQEVFPVASPLIRRNLAEIIRHCRPSPALPNGKVVSEQWFFNIVSRHLQVLTLEDKFACLRALVDEGRPQKFEGFYQALFSPTVRSDPQFIATAKAFGQDLALHVVRNLAGYESGVLARRMLTLLFDVVGADPNYLYLDSTGKPFTLLHRVQNASMASVLMQFVSSSLLKFRDGHGNTPLFRYLLVLWSAHASNYPMPPQTHFGNSPSIGTLKQFVQICKTQGLRLDDTNLAGQTAFEFAVLKHFVQLPQDVVVQFREYLEEDS